MIDKMKLMYMVENKRVWWEWFESADPQFYGESVMGIKELKKVAYKKRIALVPDESEKMVFGG